MSQFLGFFVTTDVLSTESELSKTASYHKSKTNFTHLLKALVDEFAPDLFFVRLSDIIMYFNVILQPVQEFGFY